MHPDTHYRFPRCRLGLALGLLLLAPAAWAQDAASLEQSQKDAQQAEDTRDGLSGKLLLTGGVTQVEGSAGGGLTPWAVIGGYGTRDQIGANAFYTQVDLDDYSLKSFGALVGVYDRVELSFARNEFDTENVGAALGLGRGFTIKQDVIGLKVKIAGDAVLEQDSALPQIAIGLQHKRNDQGGLVRAIGARDDSGTDIYISATKLFLGQSLLLNGTLRFTEANQFGILGFGGDKDDGYSAQFEASAAYLITRNLAIGAEYRTKPDNLGIAVEDDAFDVFVAWAPVKNVSLTVAYVDLGNIVIADKQRGVYASLQVGF